MSFEEIFDNKKPNVEKLKEYGFSCYDGKLVYHVRILDAQFELTVAVSENGDVAAQLIDVAFEEPYTQHLVAEAEGEFVGRVREAYERALTAICEACFETDVYREPLTQRLIEHAAEKYGDEPEYLWKQFPDTAILRRKDSEKWYAIFMSVERKKLGLSGMGRVEVLDVRVDPVELPLLVDGVRVLPGWHMNKKHWVSVLLDGTVPFDELTEYLEESWHLAK